MRKLTKIGAIVAAMACSHVMAQPTGGVFTLGSGSITQNDKETVVKINPWTGSNGVLNYSIDWNSLNLASDEQITLNCMGAVGSGSNGFAYVILNVLPGNASQIEGKIVSSNCRVLLANPDGIALGDSAVVKASSFVAVAASHIEPQKVSVDASNYSYAYLDVTGAPVTATSKTSFLNYSNDVSLGGAFVFNVPQGVAAHTPILVNANTDGIVFTGSGSMSGDTVLAGFMFIRPQIETVFSGRLLSNDYSAPHIQVDPSNNNLYSVGSLALAGNGVMGMGDDLVSGILNFKNAKSLKNFSISNDTPYNTSLGLTNPPSDLSGSFNKVDLSLIGASSTGKAYTCNQKYDQDGNPIPLAGDYYACPEDTYGQIPNRTVGSSLSVTNGALNLSNVTIAAGVTVKADKGGTLDSVLNEGVLDVTSELTTCKVWENSVQVSMPCSNLAIYNNIENKGVMSVGPMYVPFSSVYLSNSGSIVSKTDGSLSVSRLFNDGTIKAYGDVSANNKSGSGVINAAGKLAQNYLLLPSNSSSSDIYVVNNDGGVIDLLRTTVIDQPIAKPIIAQPIAKRILVAPVATVRKPAKAMVAR